MMSRVKDGHPQVRTRHVCTVQERFMMQLLATREPVPHELLFRRHLVVLQQARGKE